MNNKAVIKKMDKLMNQVDAVYVLIAQKHGLTYNSLMMLYLADECDTLTQKQVCDALYLSKSSVHSILSRLMAKGYLVLKAGGNKKEKYIGFTEAGKKLMTAINDETEKIVYVALSSVSDSEMQHFLKTAGRLSEYMSLAADQLYEERGETE